MPADEASVEIAVPPPSAALPGVSVAGFCHRAGAPLEIPMIVHPSVTLLIDLGDGEPVVYEASGRRERGSVVAGLLPGDLRVTGRASGQLLQIRMDPVAAATLLGGASAELSGTVATLDEVLGRDAGQAEDRLRTAASWDERFTAVLEIVGPRLAGRPRVDPQVAHAWRRTLFSRGQVRVDELAGEVGWSRQRLWSRFRSQLGVTPKRAARLVRFDHAAHLLAAGHAAARVAAGNGYADQSHLHREIATFAGLTPTALAVAPWLAVDDVAWPASSPVATSRRRPPERLIVAMGNKVGRGGG
ncbi:helix-turn-helix domain-containing protein [Kribbella sp. NPDC020789]